MSKFKKLTIILFSFLIIEFLIILSNYFNNIESFKDVNIEGYKPGKPIVILVNIPSNELAVFQNGNLIKTYTVASGKPSTPSPIGTWKIISKGTWGEGFGGRWMGFNVPWGKYGIHGTNKPNSIGWNSSHGCIRMKNEDVAELYKITPYGTQVIIYGGPYGNFGSYLRILKPGMRGSDVYEVQRLLKYKGYYKANPDGIYGDYMKNIVHKFQKENKLPISDTVSYSFYKKLGVILMD